MNKLIKGVLVYVLAIGALHAQRDNEVIKESFKVQENTKEFWFCICNINGSIEVEAYDGSTIEVELNKQVFGRDNADVQKGMQDLKMVVEQDRDFVKLYMDSPQQNVRQKDDRLACGWNWNGNRRGPKYWYEFDYKVKVPRGISVKVSTVNKGDVRVQGAQGNIYAGNVNGDVTVEGAQENVKASTVNGEVEVSFDRMPSEFGKFDTVNGDIIIETPQQADGVYNFQTQWGKVYSDIDFDKKVAPKMEKTSGESGGTKYRISNSNGYQVGDGGPNLEFETLNGTIRLRKKR